MAEKPQDNDDLLRKVKDQVQEALTQVKPEAALPAASDADNRQILLSEEAIETVGALSTVEGLPKPTRDESIEEARKILRWLRNMEFTENTLEQWLDNSAPKVAAAKKEALQRLLRIIAINIHAAQIQGLNANDPTIENAIDALKAIALTAAEHTFNMLLNHEAKVEKLERLIDEMDERAMLRQEQSVAQLLDVIEFGMERATGQEVSDLSAAFRLQTLSQELHNTSFQLQSVESLGEPTREESLELARDILRKMQGMSFGEQTIKELIETGKAEDKAAFARAFTEMAGVYRNLMAEAAAVNPNILQDHRIEQANEAIKQFTHSVHLMAAKEIPSSVAAAQQISAEVTRAPEEWGKLSSRTVDRLVKSAEGGLEKAIEEVAEQQERAQEDEQAQEAAEQALQQADQKKRKKKRRGDSKSRSGKGGKKQRKQHQDMTADDYVLKEGRFATDASAARAPAAPAPATPSMPGVKMEDMDAIRKLGGSLRDIGKQLKDVASTVSSVSANDKITPDDKSITQRVIETELQKGSKNQGPGGSKL